MKYIQIHTIPKRKHKAIVVMDSDNESVAYVIGYILYAEDKFREALKDIGKHYINYTEDE